MKRIFFIALAVIPSFLYSQAIVKGSGIIYTNGIPTHAPNINTDAEVAIDTTSGLWYERSRDGLGWLAAGFRIQKITGSSAPSGAPADKESEVVLNDVDSLYRWRAGAWQHLNKIITYSAGTGIDIDGSNIISNTGDLLTTNEGVLGVGAGGATSSTIISNTSGAAGVTLNVGGILSISESTSSNGGSITITGTEVDGSVSNEGTLGVGAGGSTSSVITSNTSGAAGVTLNVAGILSITESTSSNGGSITITATEVDGSTTNELQTFANTSDATSHTLTLSNSGGSIQLVEGANVTLTTTGTSSAGIVTIAASSGGGADLSYSGTTSPITLASSTGTDVTITQGGIVTITASGSNMTISATEVDGSTTNELQTFANTSDATSHTVTLSNSGGSVQLVEGANITLTTTGTSADGIVTIASTGGGGSADLSYSGTTSPITLESSTGTDVTITEGGIVTITASGSNMTISATEVDGSTTNELQTFANTSDATSHTLTLSNSGGSIQLVEGANVTLTTTGTSSAGIVTIAASSGGGADLSYSGTTSPITLASSTGTDVTITQGGIVTITASGSNMTISATEVDGSTTNELQTFANTSDATSHTVTLSNSGGSVQLVEGANITLTTTGTSADGIVTIAASSGGGTDLSYSGTTSPITLVSNTGTDVTFTEGGIVTITASGSNMTINATEVDGSVSNEGTLGVGAGGSTSSVITSNTSGATGVTVNVAGILSISESTSSNGGSITITGTEVDGSTTNELQTFANTSDATSHTVTLSNSGGSVQLVEGSNITLTTTGTSADGILTIAGAAADLTYSGTTSPITLASSTGTDVTFTQGGIVTITASGSNMTISATEVDGSTTNELQTFANTSDATSHTLTLSNSGGSIQLVEGANVTLTTTGTSSAGIVTIAATSGGGADLSYSGTTSPITLNSSTGTDVTFTEGGIVTITASGSNMTISATEVDGSTTNELQTFANTSNATSHTVTLSNSGGSVQLVEGSNITLTTTGTSADGIVTIATPNIDLSYSGTTSPITLASNTGTDVTFTEGGIVTITASGSNMTISATEVDGSTTNELQTFANTSNATSHTVTLSNSGGSVQLVEGTNISLTTTGTSADGIVTIASTGTDLSYSGTSSPVTLASNTGTDVTFTQGGIVTITASGSNMTISATEVDGSTTNELQTFANTSDATSHTVTLSNSGGSVQLVEGSNITLTTTGTSADGIVTIAASGSGGTDFSSVIGYVEGITGTTIDLDANDGNTKDVDGSNLLFDIPSNTNNFRVFKNGVELNLSGSGTTRDYSVNTSTNVLTLTTSLTTSDRLIVQSITGSSPDIFSSGEITGAGTIASPLHLAQQSATSGQVLAWNGTQYSPTSVSVTPSVISPTQITADQDNYNPTGFDGASYVRLTSDNFRAITSFAAQTDGEEKTLVNIGSFPIYFPGQHPDGTAANRIITPYDYFLFPGKAVKIVYDNTSARWFIIGQKERNRNGVYYETSFGSVTAGDWPIVTFTTSGTAAAAASFTATSAVPGGVSLGTGSTTTGFAAASFSKTLTSPVYFSGSHIAADATVSIPTLSDGTETFTAGIMVTNGPTSTTFTPNNSIGIRYTHSVNTGKWLGFSKDNAGAETTVDLGVTVAAATAYRLRVEDDKQNAEVRFYVDGVMAGRITANLPTGTTAGFRTVILKSAGSTSRSINAHSMTLEGIY